MPGLEQGEEQEASFNQSDDEDLDAGFVQTSYSPPRKSESSQTKAPRVTSVSKSALKGKDAKKIAAAASPVERTKPEPKRKPKREEDALQSNPQRVADDSSEGAR
jgi:hypothetical protein